MKKLVVLCTVILVLSVVAVFAPVVSDAGIFRQTLRLHVVANSECPDDQALKYLVRDRLIEELDLLFALDMDIIAAEAVIVENHARLLYVVQNVIYEMGRDIVATLSVETAFFPTMSYMDTSFPAGRYRAVVVNLGEADGANWWCVLFPPLCLAAASANRPSNAERLYEAGFSPDQVRVITENETNTRFEIRFRLLEMFGNRRR